MGDTMGISRVSPAISGLLLVVSLSVARAWSLFGTPEPEKLDYWEWRDTNRTQIFQYKTLATGAPRALLLDGYINRNTETAALLQTEFLESFWLQWALCPQ